MNLERLLMSIDGFLPIGVQFQHASIAVALQTNINLLADHPNWPVDDNIAE